MPDQVGHDVITDSDRRFVIAGHDVITDSDRRFVIAGLTGNLYYGTSTALMISEMI